MIYERPDSKNLWYSFVFSGRRIQKSTKVSNWREAEKIEKAAWTQLARNEVGIGDRPRFTIAGLLDRLKQRWELERKATSQNLSLLKKTKEDFANKMADDLTAQDLERYALRRRRAEYANASTNRILQCVRRAYNLAGLTPPKFELLPEENRRMGFFAAEQMRAVLANLPNDGTRDFCEAAWVTGVRKSELAGLRWSFIHEGQIVIPAQICKSRKPHVVPIAGPLAAILKRREAARAFESNGTTQLSEYIFHRNDGQPVLEFRKSCRSACVAAGCGNMLFHDLRRSFCRDAIRSGTPQSVAMACGGWRTVAVFNRYDICAAEDMTAALEKTAAYRTG
jgi:integrase